jgi:UDP-GlcNAc:undecaprenyl-phosphate GlcNAc-1-phosphate transferase
MAFPFALITAMVLSMMLIPIMIRLAPRIGMIDMPDPRKVHANPIPRVGGIGIVIGALISMVIWMPPQGWLLSYLTGALILFAFGAWDDAAEVGHYVKFIGQFAAAILVVYWGGLWVEQFPFLATPLSPLLGKPFSVIAIVGMINAINHSDGLDGLAGGESVLSLGCIAYLAWLAGGMDTLIVCGAIVGGLFGFLRFNTHPARVFMGDSGSQFLGFSLGVLAVMLTQRVNTGMSMALPALILGLPIVDILAVLFQRVSQGMNWFRATKNHIHHRLLELGFHHHEAVTIIYSVQAMLVLGAIVLRYESDALVIATYLTVCGLVFVAIAAAERAGWRARRSGYLSVMASFSDHVRGSTWVLKLPLLFVQISVPIYLILASLTVHDVSGDVAMVAAVVAVCALFGLIPAIRQPVSPIFVRGGVFGCAVLVLYLSQRYGQSLLGIPKSFVFAYFVVLAVATGLAIRLEGEKGFRTTPMDYLLVIVVLVSAFLARDAAVGFDLSSIILRLVVLFYGCELIIVRSSGRWISTLAGLSMISAGILAIRAISH